MQICITASGATLFKCTGTPAALMARIKTKEMLRAILPLQIIFFLHQSQFPASTSVWFFEIFISAAIPCHFQTVCLKPNPTCIFLFQNISKTRQAHHEDNDCCCLPLPPCLNVDGWHIRFWSTVSIVEVNEFHFSCWRWGSSKTGFWRQEPSCRWENWFLGQCRGRKMSEKWRLLGYIRMWKKCWKTW